MKTVCKQTNKPPSLNIFSDEYRARIAVQRIAYFKSDTNSSTPTGKPDHFHFHSHDSFLAGGFILCLIHNDVIKAEVRIFPHTESVTVEKTV